MSRGVAGSGNRAMSGKWQVFFLFIGVAFGFPLVLAIWPIATRERIADVLRVGLDIIMWLFDGMSGYILFYGFLIVGFLMTIAAVYMAGEKIYYWVQGWQDDTVNEYQIK